MFHQVAHPVSGLLALSALVAALPLLTLFVRQLVYPQPTPVLNWMMMG